jgi:hypothetical protein
MARRLALAFPHMEYQPRERSSLVEQPKKKSNKPLFFATAISMSGSACSRAATKATDKIEAMTPVDSARTDLLAPRRSHLRHDHVRKQCLKAAMQLVA